MKKVKYLAILLLLLGSYSCKDDVDFEQQRDERPLLPAIMEARSFFEEYAANVELSEEMFGLYPGNFAPDWSKSVVTADPTTTVVNVPIVSDIAYEGTFIANYDSVGVASPEVYYTAVGQKMVVAKNRETGAFGCYIVTIIPDQANATKSSHAAAKMYDNGDPATTFSGTAFFTVLGGNHYPVAAGRYRNGERYAAASLWWNTDGNAQKLSEDLSALMGAVRFYTRERTMNKECLVVPPTQFSTTDLFGNSGSGGYYDNSSAAAQAWVFYQQSVYNYQMANNLDANNNPIISGNGSGQGLSGSSGTGTPAGYSGTSSTTTNTTQNSKSCPTPQEYRAETGDVFFNGKYPPQIIHTQVENGCVIYTLGYVHMQLFGGNKSWNDFANAFRGKIKDKKGRKMDAERDGVPSKDLNATSVIRDHFTIDYGFANNASFKEIFDKKAKDGIPRVVLTAIPWAGDERAPHFIVVIGYRANGDVIFQNPQYKVLQVVNPSYITNFITKINHPQIVVTGIIK